MINAHSCLSPGLHLLSLSQMGNLGSAATKRPEQGLLGPLAWGVNARAVVVPDVDRPEGLAVVRGGTLHRQLPGVVLQGLGRLIALLLTVNGRSER